MRHLDALQLGPLDTDLSRDLQRHGKQIKEPLLSFLGDIQRSYDSSLGRNSALPAMLSAPRKVQWALFAAKRARRLREQIAMPLMAIQIAMSQQIM